ncbi:MAG TPA: hypothetical protein VFX49_16725 [Chloroflexota bacterium]|nr:hypothetical protein [Chloroflexota bacterium]
MTSLAQQLDSTDSAALPRADYPRRRPFMTRGGLRRARPIPTGGEALVRVGDHVESGARVARGAREMRATVIDLAASLGVDGDAARYLTRAVGDEVAQGEALAERRALGGLQRRAVRAPFSGRLAHVSEHTGLAYLVPPSAEQTVLAHLTGRVVAVDERAVTIEGSAFAVTARAGAGPAVAGVLMVAEALERLPRDVAGAIVACGFPVNEATVRALLDGGAAAIVAATVEEETLERLGWDDAFWARAGTPPPAPPATLLALSFSAAPPAGVWEALRALAGRPASALGWELTPDGGRITPELLVALGENAPSLYGLPEGGEADVELRPGTRVRAIAGRAIGLVGEVIALSPGPFRLRSEIGTEVADVSFPYGVRLRLPVTHLQVMP